MKMIKKYFYISTPIYYPSDKPHIGHAYTTLLADCISKYKKILGYETFFVTGTDEHGQKIEQVAFKKNMSPQELVNQNSSIFLELWKKMKIDYSYFVRTSSSDHEKVVQDVFSILLKKGLIYLSKWKGLYCISCEENYKESDAIKISGKYYCKQNHELVLKDELSYFLRISEFNNWIIDFYSKNTNVIFPKFRYNELFNNFLKENKLEDLSVTRTNFSWGVKVKEDEKHVIYVWIDALLSYITALGFMKKDDSNFLNFWQNKDSERVHLLSKEITRFHCIYWPILLHNLDLNQPTKIVSHGWIITKEGKMSKSLGNVIDPNDLIDKYGLDAFRYCLLKNISLKDDSYFDEQKFISTFNNDLANNFGNLVNRLIGLIKKYSNGELQIDLSKLTDKKIIRESLLFKEKIILEITNLDVQNVINSIVNFENFVNNYIEQTKPWEFAKNNNKKDLDDFLLNLYYCVLQITFWISPIIPEAIEKIKFFIDIKEEKFNFDNIINMNYKDTIKLNASDVLFSRLEIDLNEK